MRGQVRADVAFYILVYLATKLCMYICFHYMGSLPPPRHYPTHYNSPRKVRGREREEGMGEEAAALPLPHTPWPPRPTGRHRLTA
jgi:hypothetical protein